MLFAAPAEYECDIQLMPLGGSLWPVMSIFVPFFCLLCFVLCEFGPGAYFHFNGCIECLQIHNLKNLDATVVLNNK